MHLFGELVHNPPFFYSFYTLRLHRNSKKDKITIKKPTNYIDFSYYVCNINHSINL